MAHTMSAIRFLFTGVRDMSGPHRDGVALEDIALLDHAGRPLQIDRATNPGGRSLPYEGPDRAIDVVDMTCLLYTSPSPRDKRQSRMPSSA